MDAAVTKTLAGVLQSKTPRHKTATDGGFMATDQNAPDCA
jgi:hypothetical protein